MDLKISGVKEVRVSWDVVPEELKSITIKRVNGLEFAPNSYQLLSLKLENVCLYAANEMMSFISVQDLSFVDCFFIVNPNARQGFSLSASCKEKILTLFISDCRINGKLLTYKDLSQFLCCSTVY